MDNEIFEALFEIVTFFNQPQQDRDLLKRAEISLEPAALPIIVRVGRQPEISIGELANQIGRNHSSVSRQVDKLVKAGWLTEVERRDQRIRRVTLSPQGQRALLQVKVAREAAFRQRLAGYSDVDRSELAHVLQRLAATLNEQD
ncbi:transcriptional regulator [Levilactobacillus senmaizukei DSM 21775 = NBRC 103853]|uniref:Transcriptional regulator n=1 Tax=Levilactobacillus senmaizukei DSM 21775 = NBRC 103853 TaxID=1423803 RepID=A0A0R2DF19_9LACO|nr:MarR family transcriptional regulator [Levilactobacillus senmaizukei]KRN01563.1 transcriptional regulator [Levilactobacillus senmaizukei DSM 21775 = NBRC 103853]